MLFYKSICVIYLYIYIIVVSKYPIHSISPLSLPLSSTTTTLQRSLTSPKAALRRLQRLAETVDAHPGEPEASKSRGGFQTCRDDA